MCEELKSPLSHWSETDLERFLQIRQEFFLDPMGSNKERFIEAAIVLQRALFDWYLSPQGKEFVGMLSLVTAKATEWSKLREDERRSLWQRRFALNSPSPDLPAVESSVPEHQWQRILGSLGLGLGDPGTFDRFLVQLDEETNPSLRVNHKYMGELLPHDNMVSYLSSMTATFLNENAIIGKVSPCVTHMEDAAVKWLFSLVGWDGLVCADKAGNTVPVQRLPIPPPPAHRYRLWDREEPTGAIVAGGTIANLSALLIARSAVFDYLLGWSGAVQWLGPSVAWDLVREIWDRKRLVVLTSKGAHYSVRKAALQAGVAAGAVIEVPGVKNPWVLDGEALSRQLAELDRGDLILAVVAIAGKTETGDVDRVKEIALALDNLEDDASAGGLSSFPAVLKKLRPMVSRIEEIIRDLVMDSKKRQETLDAFAGAVASWDSDYVTRLCERVEAGNEVIHAKHNRPFFHVDAAHGGAYLAVPELRKSVFDGIELADTITIDGHKSFYCYYPCGGLLVRTTRWAQTFSTADSAYISEEENRCAYREGLMWTQERQERQAKKGKERKFVVGREFNEDRLNCPENPSLACDEEDIARLAAVYQLTGRPLAAGRSERSELSHQPFNKYLEGSRGPQGIMQLYFSLATLGWSGYQALLGWTALLRARAEEAISLGMSDVRLVTDPALPVDLHASDKQAAIQSAGGQPGERRSRFSELQREPVTVVPIGGGRFLRLSDGHCNQLLMTYVPAREAKLIATANLAYWKDKEARMQDTMTFLWRVNERLWHDHIYANPHFTYYLGHTVFNLELPFVKEKPEDGQPVEEPPPTWSTAAEDVATLLVSWNAWVRQRSDGKNPFFQALLTAFSRAEWQQRTQPGKENSDPWALQPYGRKFFCHKAVFMHPYTDESLIGDMLRRLAFWGERSADDVRVADASAQLLFPSAASSKPDPDDQGRNPR